jgi:iron complex outermembrane receptor protein
VWRLRRLRCTAGHGRRQLAGWTTLAWLAACVAPADALASDLVQLSEVVITARKRDEKLADVPLSVSVLDESALAGGNVSGLREIASRVPGLAFEPGILLPIPILRGQWQPSIAGDNVGVFVDGVYQSNRAAIDVELLDLARVEVVAGPQSALFGHSTFVGAINYVSRAPTARSGTGAVIEAGTDRWRMAEAWWSGPFLAGWNARVAGSARAADGTWVNDADRKPLGGFDRRALALTLQRAADASVRWRVMVRARFGDSRNQLPAMNLLEGADYNCGSRDPASGLWSYYCGRASARTSRALMRRLPVPCCTLPVSRCVAFNCRPTSRGASWSRVEFCGAPRMTRSVLARLSDSMTSSVRPLAT